jgi:hypothetical protein
MYIPLYRNIEQNCDSMIQVKILKLSKDKK